MKKSMCKIMSIVMLCLFFVSASTGCATKDKSVTGKWIDVETEAVFEYTSDGYYYEYTNENFTSQKTRYIAKNGKITYYLDGDTPDGNTAYSVKYEITSEGNLIIGDKIEYRPLVIPEKD